MKPTDDIRTFIAKSLQYDQCIDATEIALLTLKLHPQYRLAELVAMVVAQRSVSRESKFWPSAGPYTLSAPVKKARCELYHPPRAGTLAVGDSGQVEFGEHEAHVTIK